MTARPSLFELKSWALQAGEILRAGFGQEHRIHHKGTVNLVTEMDQRSEDFLLKEIRQHYPDHSILAEESGAMAGLDSHCWYLDPLDGTTNFIHGLPNYAVSIALTQRGQVTQAVIYDPSRNELFTASRGSGTFLNDRRVRVSGRTRYHEALLGAHWPNSGDLEQGSQRFRAMAEGSTGVRRLGATVLDLAYVACGRLDGFCGVGLKPWDLAAGSLMVLEAGGLVADFDGEQGWMDSGNVLAASPKIFTQMLSALNPTPAA